MNRLDFLNAIANEYGLILKTEETSAVLTDPRTGRFIEIHEDRCGDFNAKDRSYQFLYTEYIVCFSTQHLHLEDPDDAEDYIRTILTDKVLPLEFYRNGERRFGGELKKEELALLSVDFLAKKYNVTANDLQQYEYEIHSWSGKYDSGRKCVADLKAF